MAIGQPSGVTPVGRVVILACLVAWASRADATIRFTPNFMIFGDVESQNLFRMRQPGNFQPVQQRNTLRLGLEYKFVDRKTLGKELPGGGVQVPWLRSASVYGLYRGVWDSVYTWGAGGNLYDFTGTRDGSIADIPSDVRKSLQFPDNDLREFYVDLNFADMPLSLRLGRQQIVWGETDNFRLLDRVNSLDLTWHLQQEIEIGKGWDRLRIPYWMIKGLWRLDRVGPVSDAFVEAFWNPGDWYPNKRGFLPFYPWSVPLTNPIPFPNGLADGTTLFRQGDYTRDPAENSQVGVRFSGLAGGVNFTAAYIYSRLAGDDGANTAFLRALSDPVAAQEEITQGKLPAQYYAPYTHTFGVSANYFEEAVTEAVFRTEMVYILGMPFLDGDKPSPVLPSQLFGVSKRDMWQGMIGFDRPTWIRWLNRSATWLLSSQFFWHYLIDNEHSVGDQVGFVGNLSPTMPLVERDGGEPCVAPPFAGCKAVDTVRDWEALFTFTATSFYQGGKIVPQITYILDPVNSWNMEVFWAVDYYVTPDFIVNLGQRFFINTTEQPVYETWGVGGLNRGRSETQLRLTYQF
jgi:hypothetical protein